MVARPAVWMLSHSTNLAVPTVAGLVLTALGRIPAGDAIAIDGWTATVLPVDHRAPSPASA